MRRTRTKKKTQTQKLCASRMRRKRNWNKMKIKRNKNCTTKKNKNERICKRKQQRNSRGADHSMRHRLVYRLIVWNAKFFFLYRTNSPDGWWRRCAFEWYAFNYRIYLCNLLPFLCRFFYWSILQSTFQIIDLKTNFQMFNEMNSQ